jgi:ATP-binding cassette subfamily B protein
MLVAAAFRADPRRAAIALVIAPVAGATTAVTAIGLRDMINAVTGHDMAGSLAAAALLAGAAVTGYLTGIISADVRIRLQQSVGLLLDQRIIQLCTGLPHLDHHEYPPYLNRLELLRAHRGELGGAFGSLLENLRAMTGFASIFGLLVGIRPAFALLLVPAVPTVLATRRGERNAAAAEQATASVARRRRSLFTLACAPEAAKEFRVYGLQDEIITRHENLQTQVIRPLRQANIRAALWTGGGWLIFGAGFAVALIVIVTAAAHGQASPGDVALTIALGGQLTSSVSSVMIMVSWLQRSVRCAGYYLWLADYAAANRPERPQAGGRPAARGADLVLEQVSFCYPGGAEVLHEVSLRLPAGRTVAIVGENGAGKTTLVKLLCQLYAPTSGRISYAGIDLASYDVGQWRSGLTACFQDFGQLKFVLRESVGVGDVGGIDDEAAVLTALAGAGAGDLPSQLPGNLRTQLGTSFPGGTDLSTGQWQKVAMSRAGMRPAPVLRILDEPAASLDPASEHEVFARYQSITSQAPGSITIFVSHRFATVRAADLIVVLDHGRVLDQGTHAQLMVRRGLYADLYALHARGYASDTPRPSGDPLLISKE